MRDPVRVMVLGTGQVGSGVARLVLRKQGLRLVGAYGRRRARSGMDLGRAIGLDRDLGLAVSGDLAPAVEAARPHIAIQATCSRLADAVEEISTLLRHGIHVISVAEEMAYPMFRSRELAEEIDRLARAHGVAILGTGINPGFVLDLLVIALTGVCADIGSITARRVNDLSPYGPTVLAAQGVGLTPEAFRAGLARGAVVGHIGFGESIRMIADTLGWDIDDIEESREPIISRVKRETPFVSVEPGQVAGCLHTAVGRRNGRPLISLFHPQQIHPHLEGVETGDSIEIAGTPSLRFSGSPEIPGGIATVALAVNAIPRMLSASPGLHTMADLPVPAAILGDARRLGVGQRFGAPMVEPIKPGTWVEVHRIVLKPGERAPQVPEDTRGVALEMRVKGFLVQASRLGEEAEVVTRAGRRLRGRLVEANPAYAHGFGPPIPELSGIGDEVRALLEESARTR